MLKWPWWIRITIIAVIWTALAWAVPPLGFLAVVLCLFFAVIDIGMNGSRHAEFASVNLAGAILAGIGAEVGQLWPI